MFFARKQKSYVRIDDFIVFSERNYLVPADEYLVEFALRQKEDFERKIKAKSAKSSRFGKEQFNKF